MIDPHAAARERRRKLIQYMQANQPQRIETASGRVVPYGIGEGISSLLRSYLLNKAATGVDTEEADALKQQQQQKSDAMQQVMKALEGRSQTGGPINYPEGQPYQQFKPEIPSNPQKAAMIAATNPALSDEKGLQAVTAAMLKSKLGKKGSSYYTQTPGTKGQLVFDTRTGESSYEKYPSEFSGPVKYDVERKTDIAKGEASGRLGEELKTKPEITKQTKLAEHEAKKIIEKPQRIAELKAGNIKLENLTQSIDKAKSQASFWTTGLFSQALGNIGGTPQGDLVNTLNTVRANLGLDALVELKKNSGAGLGSVTEAEHTLLQAMWRSLLASQSKEQLLENLDAVEEQAKKSWKIVADAYEAEYGKPFEDFPSYIETRTLEDGRIMGKRRDGTLEFLP